ncbi:crotonobetaine/carnitine-CoA ligase [Geodermatophilus bullaregiensis]|uniref:AMP-binding protein n=1 Tax=Geodermatophilus bullaregiensis TaxID=1564160 RepID=UPI001955FF79|nr:AMP-binding protein [Geodermatophilus bullaregiensis]MBM7808740.1 crotonobetaine/carnitine-CoA ligase [Geodermatophilus bullaregiensis]
MTVAPSIGDWLAAAAARAAPASGALVAGETVAWRGLDARADRAAAGFRALGLRSGDRVCVLMRSSTATLAVWFGLARAGLVEVPLNPASGRTLLRYLLEHSGAPVVVCDAEFLDAVRECSPGTVRTVVVHGTGAGDVDLADLLATAPEPLPPVDPTAPAVVLYTSGTTGPPKGALLSHRANVNLARHTVALMGYTPADRLYSVFPLFHSNARYCSVMAAAEAGADLVLDRTFSAGRFWDTCRAHGITAFNYQGAMTSILAKQPPRPDDADNPVRVGFGAPCPPELFADFERRFGVRLTEIYGSTEVSVVTDMPPTARRIGTAGRESVNYTVAVVDERDEPVPAGTPGEIVARPKHAGWMFDGYAGDPGATAAAWRGLWFHTGDRGVLDADGFLTFLDRMKDTIRRRGENVSSWEVERVVAEHPAVGQVAAYGLPSELSEEDVAVAVVPAAGATVDPAELVEHCRAGLTAFAVPRYVRVLDELPLTPSQRVEKYKLRADGVAPGTWDREAR